MPPSHQSALLPSPGSEGQHRRQHAHQRDKWAHMGFDIPIGSMGCGPGSVAGAVSSPQTQQVQEQQRGERYQPCSLTLPSIAISPLPLQGSKGGEEPRCAKVNTHLHLQQAPPDATLGSFLPLYLQCRCLGSKSLNSTQLNPALSHHLGPGCAPRSVGALLGEY